MIDFSIPQAGLDRATDSLNRTASRIANLNTPGDSVDLSSEMVALIQARASFTANTKVIKTEDQMAKSLLDMVG